MNRTHIFLATATALVGVGLALIWFVFFAPTQPSPSSDIAPITLPQGGVVPRDNLSTDGTVPPETQATMTVQSMDGAMITTLDFIHNGVTVRDTQNPDQYYLAGAIGYCLPDGTCPSGAPSEDYHIVYFVKDQSFIIALRREPLGQTREAAGQFLLKTLGISSAQLCALKYYVGTNARTSEFYAGKNLGFSFCPGATILP